jgi:predicted nucleic acid-binding protein
MRIPRYYLDTSVLNFAFEAEAVEYREASLALLDEVRSGSIEAHISDVVLREVSRAPAVRRTQLRGLIGGIQAQVLELTDLAQELAEKYVAEGIIPRRYVDDARHIAVAVVNGLDCVVSWNFRHLVRPATRRRVNAVSRLLGYPEIDIVSPEEVL